MTQSNMDYVNSLEDCIKEWVSEGEGRDELLGFVDGLHRRFAEIADLLDLWEVPKGPPCEVAGCDEVAEWEGWWRALDPFLGTPTGLTQRRNVCDGHKNVLINEED